MYEDKNIKSQFKRNFGLLIVLMIIVAILYILEFLGLINLPE